MVTGRRRGPRGIHVPGDVASAAGLPEDLDADAVGPYAVPDPIRRRRSGAVYFAAAVATAGGIAAGLPTGLWVMVAGFVLIGAYHLVSGWHLVIREGRALQMANIATQFPVGHASAALGFEGWRARPIWNVLVFSADDPPSQRGLVRVDGITGTVMEQYVEEIPAAER